ncbi:MAG: succinylglutamate desuccinylase/aspartoacylase family protein [Chloroflexota bacterium]
MSKEIRLGTAVSQPGTLQYGQWDAISHPTGHGDWMPVVIAQGKADGPCIWLTTGIHGPEHAGPTILYKLLTQELVDQLRGTIVAIPALSPAGLRTKAYVPYHVHTNPNRLWPDGKPKKEPDPEKIGLSSVEDSFARLFEPMLETADYLIDYHNAQIGSISFVFRDRVLYRTDTGDAKANKAEAEAISAKMDGMIAAYGHTVVNEYAADRYVKNDLHRSTSGAALQVGRIPGFTLELGAGLMPDPAIVQASMAGTRNVLRWAGMLDGDTEPISGIKVVEPGYQARRTLMVKSPGACVVLHVAQPGDVVQKGDVLAELRDVWGRPFGDGVVRAEVDGFIVGRSHGIYFYPGQTLFSMAVRDDAPLVAPYPDGYFD